MAFEGLTEKLSNAFKKLRGKGRLSESDIKEAMREIRLALLEADVSYKVVKDFIKSVSERCSGQDVMESLTPAQTIVKIVNEELIRLMGSENQRISISPKPPTVVMLVGLQGAGKTTNGAKLAGLFKKQGKRPLLVACDIYRPAAIKQLEVVGGQLGIPVFQMGQENPVKIAKAAIRHAQQHGNDMVFLDTAGRLHVDEALMDELKAVKAAVNPDEILLVVDAMTGQDAVSAAKTFDEYLDITGVMLSKLDGDARGGAALSIKAVTGKPIKFIGTGEKLDQIEPFHPDRMASRILGMGDVLSLIEKAQSAFDEKKAAEQLNKLRTDAFTLDDFLDQLYQLKSDIEFIAVSSYQNATTSSGVVQITRDPQQDITGRDLVVIEDILDSGNTLYFLKNYFMTKGASSVTVVTLLDKPARRTKPIAADLAGFEVPDEFVVGYGLDYAQKYRNMPYIGVLKPEVYSEN